MTADSQIRLCLHCEHRMASPMGDECGRRVVTNPVSGKRYFELCASERAWSHLCGREGKHYVEREAARISAAEQITVAGNKDCATDPKR